MSKINREVTWPTSNLQASRRPLCYYPTSGTISFLHTILQTGQKRKTCDSNGGPRCRRIMPTLPQFRLLRKGRQEVRGSEWGRKARKQSKIIQKNKGSDEESATARFNQTQSRQGKKDTGATIQGWSDQHRSKQLTMERSNCICRLCREGFKPGLLVKIPVCFHQAFSSLTRTLGLFRK